NHYCSMCFFFFSSRRRHTRSTRDWSSDVCSSDLVGWLTERIAVRPLVERGAPLLAPILALLGMLVVFREAISVSFPPDPHPVPYALGIQRQSFFIIAVTSVVFIGVWLFFERTVAGKSFEAVAIHRRAAALMGINLSRVTALSFAGGAGA